MSSLTIASLIGFVSFVTAITLNYYVYQESDDDSFHLGHIFAIISFIVAIWIRWVRYQQEPKHAYHIEPYNLWDETNIRIEIPKHTFPPPERLKVLDDIFDHPKHGYFIGSYYNKKLHYRQSLPADDKPMKGIIIWQHGIHSQSGFGMKQKLGNYTQFALRTRKYKDAGFAVYAMDQLGHGFSEGERFLIPNGDWKINRNDLLLFIQFVLSQHSNKEIPLFLIGDSYGGNTVLHTARYYQDHPTEKPTNFYGILLNCPAIIGDLPPKHIIFILRHLLAPLFPRWTPFFMPHPVNPKRIWKDDEPRLYHTNPKLGYGLGKGGKPFCLGTAVGLLNATEDVRSITIPGFNIPFYVQHGTKDYAVPIAGSEYLIQHCKTLESDRQFVKLNGAYHCLYSSSDASQIMQGEINWIHQRIAKEEKEKTQAKIPN